LPSLADAEPGIGALICMVSNANSVQKSRSE